MSGSDNDAAGAAAAAGNAGSTAGARDPSPARPPAAGEGGVPAARKRRRAADGGREDGPKTHVSYVRRKQRSPGKAGWTYVYEVESVYDPAIKNSRPVRTRLLGQLPPGKTDLADMVGTGRRGRGAAGAGEGAGDARVVYPLDLTLFVFVLAGLHGLTASDEIAGFWKEHRGVLGTVFPSFPDRDIPESAVRRLLMLFRRDSRGFIIENFFRVLREGSPSSRSTERLGFAIDGGDLILEQERPRDDAEDGSGGLLDRLDIVGAVVACDTRRKVVRSIRAILNRGADCCVVISAHQKILHDFMSACFAAGDPPPAECRQVFRDWDRGQPVEYTVRVLPGALLRRSAESVRRWAWLENGCLVQVVRRRVSLLPQEKNRRRVRYYAVSLHCDPGRAPDRVMRIVSQHWRGAGSRHWTLDVFFSEDAALCRNAAYIAGRALLTTIAFSLLTDLKNLQARHKTGRFSPGHDWIPRPDDLAGTIVHLVDLFAEAR